MHAAISAASYGRTQLTDDRTEEQEDGLPSQPHPGCAPADAPQMHPDPAAGATGVSEDWADMFPLPEGFTLKEYPPLSEERIAELALMFGTARD